MPGLLLLFSLDCACGGGAREDEDEDEDEEEVVGSSGKVNLLEKVVLVLLAFEANTVTEGSGFLPSRRILGRIITAYVIKACTIKKCTIKAGAGS